MKTIRQRLIAEFLLLVLTSVALVWAGASWVVRDTFKAYVTSQQRLRAESLASDLADYYKTSGSWEDVGFYVSSPFTKGHGAMMGQGAGRMRQLQDRIVIWDRDGKVVYDNMPEYGEASGVLKSLAVDIMSGRDKLGSVAVAAAGTQGVIGALEQAFLDRVGLIVTLSGLLSLALAFVLGHRMAAGISRPLELLREASRDVAVGRFGRRVATDVSKAPVEVQDLVVGFNRMSSELALTESRKTEFLRDIAHEIRTPLTIIGGNLEALAAGAVSLDNETVSAMSEEVARLEGLVSSLRQVDPDALPATASPVTVKPSVLVERAVASVQGAGAAKNVRVEAGVDPDLPDVYVDPQLIQQVFSNLLSNALRYTPSGGSITVEAGVDPSSETDRATVEFRVKDSGPGIPEEDLPRVFDRFFRGDRSRSRATGGWGLGLAIAKGLVDKSGGRIYAHNTGTGAVFSFTLPAVASTVVR